jgi:hypothetical protein
MKILFLLFISSLLFFYSCKDDDNTITIAEGYIYHSGTKKPLEGVSIYIYDGLPYSNKGSSNRDSTLTNSSGFFHLEIEAEEPVLFPYKAGYSFEYVIGGAVIGIVPLNVGENKNLRFELEAPAYFDPIFVNKYLNILDTLKFLDYAISSYNLKYGIGASGYIEHVGFEPFSPYKNYPRLSKGDKYHLYIIEVTRIGNKLTKIDSVYIPSFTTWADTIWY